MKDIQWPEVSVVMASYNEEGTITAAIKSIQQQTFLNWEMVVIDDCSSDNTVSIIQEFCKSDPRIRLLINDKNYGLAKSLNRGIAVARGKYIARMDADDASYPDRFQLQVDYLDVNPEISVVGGNADFLTKDGRYLNKSNMPRSPEQIKRVIVRMCPLIHPSVMCRREFLAVMGGYDEKLRRKQDYDLWLRGVAGYKYANIGNTILSYTTQNSKPVATDIYGFYVRCTNAHRNKTYVRGFSWALVTLFICFMRKIGYQPRALRGCGDRAK